MTERLVVDVIIVGAGPAGLSCAIRLKQQAQARGQFLSVCVLEKGAEVGAHILSGALLEPRALDGLLPDWRSDPTFPDVTPVQEDGFMLLTKSKAIRLPTPPSMRNHGNVIISLGSLCRWLAQKAEALGVEIYCGFPAVALLRGEEGRVIGVKTGDQGRQKDGSEGSGFQGGIEIEAKYTVLAEGCRGSLSKQAMAAFHLEMGPQTYGIGFKEVWRVRPEVHVAGRVVHTIGWPLDNKTYGGSFLYHLKDGRVAVGFVVGLDYKNPHLDPYEEFQRFKTHPAFSSLFEGAERLSYGARALNEGGLQALPKLEFPGGMLVGCAAGFLNVAKIKGIHLSMQSGMLAAESMSDLLGHICTPSGSYAERIRQSWIWKELDAVRNIRPGFSLGLWAGLANAALEAYVLKGRGPWTLSHRPDHTCLDMAEKHPAIAYPKPDGKITFDRLTSVALTGTMHREDEPCHLHLANQATPIATNLALYHAPEQRYCPAGVYEIVTEKGESRLQINGQNCIHCKTCDIKDPTQNIAWVPPEGGGGPRYGDM